MATTKNKAVEATSISQPTPSTEPVKAESTNAKPEKQSQLATILIGLLIVASGLLIYNYFQVSNAPQTTTVSDNTQQTEQPDNTDADNETSDQAELPADQPNYTVVAGDSLWLIAERVYGDGHRWTEIAEVNQLTVDASGRPIVVSGQSLVIPDSAASVVVEQPDTTVSQPTASQMTSYTVVQGDTLWSIAEKAYGDGQQWTKIFNDSSNRLGYLPDGRPLIHAGNVLVIPR